MTEYEALLQKYNGEKYIIHKIIRKGDIDGLKTLLKLKPLKDGTTFNFSLCCAVRLNYRDIVEYLIDNYQGKHLQYHLSETLRYTAMDDNIELTKYLIERGADPHYGNELALRIAVCYNSINTVVFLINNCGADPSSCNWDAVNTAFRKNYWDILDILVDSPKENIKYSISPTDLKIVSLLNKRDTWFTKRWIEHRKKKGL